MAIFDPVNLSLVAQLQQSTTLTTPGGAYVYRVMLWFNPAIPAEVKAENSILV